MASGGLGELIVQSLLLKDTFVHTLLSQMLRLGMEVSWSPQSPRGSFTPGGMGLLPFRPKVMGLCLFKPKVMGLWRLGLR